MIPEKPLSWLLKCLEQLEAAENSASAEQKAQKTQTSKHYLYLVVAINYATRFVGAHPVKTATASNLDSFLNGQVIQRFGIPQKLIIPPWLITSRPMGRLKGSFRP